jgi:DNA-binding MarR family transcriptional regulator
MMDIDRLRVLRALRLKGRVLATDLAGAAGVDESLSASLLQELSSQGYVEEARGRLKLTLSGREHLEEQLTSERQTVDGELVRSLYEEFDEHNGALKSLMTRWQLKTEDTPNDHTDLEYDQAVIGDLSILDNGFQPLLTRMVQAVPRLGHYPHRLSGALSRIGAGDHTWFARPLADSYHTVWFELHEDLIGLAGLSRVEEAAAGRAE